MENVPGEIRDDSTVGYLQAGTVVIERPSHLNWQAVLKCEVNAKGFTVPFRLIVTGAGPGTRDVATIGFRSWNTVRGGVTIYLATGIVQHALNRLPLLFLCQAAFEQESQTVDVSVHRFDGKLAVVSRRGNRGRVDHVFNIAHRGRQWLSAIMFQQTKIRVLVKCY